MGRPLQNVRLTNWPAGRVAQVKTAIQRLESILNTSAGTQINQPSKRELSNRVPIVQNVTVRAGVRNFQVTFPDPQGIDDLLFYEVQHDTSEVFSNPTTLETAIPSISVGGVEGGVARFVRVRAVNSKFRVGPWSETSTFTTADFRINTTRVGQGSLTTVATASYDTWIDLASTTYTAVGGVVSVTTLVAMRFNEDTPIAGGATTRRSTAALDFRVLRGGTELAIGRVAAQANSDDGSASANQVLIAGSLVTPFESLTGGSNTYTIQGMIVSSETTRVNNLGATSTLNDITLAVDLFDIVEVVGA